MNSRFRIAFLLSLTVSHGLTGMAKTDQSFSSETDIKTIEKEISDVFNARLESKGVSFTPSIGEISDTSMIKDISLPSPLGVYKSGRVIQPLTNSSAARTAPLPVNNEKFFSADRVLGSYEINTYTITFTVSGSTTKTYSVKGVYGQSSSTLSVTFADDGTAQIAAQRFISNNTTYGDIWFCPVDLKSGTYSLTDPLICTRDEKGNWSMGAWALVVNNATDKGYNGSILFASEKSRWFVPNMQATYEISDDSGNKSQAGFSGAWFQDDPSSLFLLNIGNTVYGRAVNVRLTSSKTGLLSPQYVSSAGGYGSLYAYYGDYSTGKADSSKSASCIVKNDSSLVFEDLIIATRTITSTSNIRLAVSPLTFNLSGERINFPEAVNVNFKGSGSASDPYLISSDADIRMLSASMAEARYASANYRMTSDIDLSSMTGFIPVGDDSNPFQGTFDGNGKTLKGLTYNGFGFPYTGFFGVIGRQGMVKNLSVSGFKIYANGSNAGIVAGFNNGGTLSGINVEGSFINTQAEVAGGLAGMNAGLLTGCNVSAEIQGYGANGGITGYNVSEIADCHFNGNMTMKGALTTSYRHIAGIAAQTLSSASNGFKSYIHDCTVSGTISDPAGYSYIGGIVAISHGSKTEDPSVIEQCINTATLSSKGLDWNADSSLPKSYCGGIAGYISATSISNCINSGLIIETSLPKIFTGGIVGIASLSFITSGSNHSLGMMSSVKNCLSTGQIYSSNGAGNGIYGAVPVLDPFDSDNVAKQIFSDCCADNQINLITTGDYGQSTSGLTSGSLPRGFSSSVWIATNGLYPGLATLKEKASAILASAPAILASGENYDNVKKNISLGGTPGVNWSILGSNGELVQSTTSLTISGSTAVIGSQYGSNWLVAHKDNMQKMIMVSIVPKLFSGSGTASDPFIIKNIADMTTLNSAVVTYGQPHRGDYFKMTADIDASADPSFVCIGYPTMTRPFEGTFDGGGFSFHKLNVKPGSTRSYGGLFSYIGSNGTVKNVVIAEDCVYDLYNISGSLAGINFGRVEGCRNYAPIIGNGMATGGIVGENDGIISSCYNAGDVTIVQNAIKTGAGGIAGANTGTIELSQNAARIGVETGKTAEAFGGITAINYGKIDRSINLGEVTAYSKAGGITAILGSYSETGEITNSGNFAIINTINDISFGAIAHEVRLSKVKDVVFDASISPAGASISPLPGCTGITTHELVSGKTPSPLQGDFLNLSTNSYPVINLFANESFTKSIRSTFIDFTTGQSMSNITADLQISAPTGTVWTLTESDYFSLSGNMLKVTVPEGLKSGKATLTASIGGVVVKSFPIVTLPILFDGKGIADDPYRIKTKEDLTSLASFISGNSYDCFNIHYILQNDLTYTAEDTFNPIGGDGITKFNGVFDGNGKTIKGIVYTNTSSKTGKTSGVFGQLGSRGVIHDLKVDNFFTGYSVGGVVAQSEGTVYNCINLGTIVATGDPGGGIIATLKEGASVRDCINQGSVSCTRTYGTGGIVGKSEADTEISSCINKGNVGNDTQGKSAGGIVGIAAGYISACTNEGIVTSASASVGGIAGRHLAARLLTITDCVNKAPIDAPAATSVAGILAGNETDKTLSNAQIHIAHCHNEANITGLLGVGGIIGIVSESEFTLTDCYNTATIEAKNTGGKSTKDTFLGGIAGCSNGTTVEGKDQFMTDCYNTGNIIGHGGNNIGGVIGKNGINVAHCYNTGSISAKFDEEVESTTGYTFTDVGGISGCAYGPLSYCWNSGLITTEASWVGGITGYTNKDIIGCANIADVIATEGILKSTADFQVVAGIVGRMGTVSYPGTIIDCYNSGNITGYDLVAGIVAQKFGGVSQIYNTYNSGKVTASKTDGRAFAIGSLGTNGAETLPPTANVYYMSENNSSASDLDRSAKGVTLNQLSSASLGEAFINKGGAIPVLAQLPDPAYTYFKAVYSVGFEKEDDSTEACKGNILYANLPGLDWSASSNLILDNGKAMPNSNGKAWLKVSMTDDPDMSKQYDVLIKDWTEVEELTSDSEIRSVEYFSAQGLKINDPRKGEIYIRRIKYRNGTAKSETIILN